MHNWMPALASQHGAALDRTTDLVHWLMLVLFVGWGCFFAYVLWRFRAKRNPVADAHGVRSHASTWLEGAVAVVEAILLVGFSIPLWADRVEHFPPPADSTQVRVVAEQFAWNVHYPGPDGVFGRTDVRENVPRGAWNRRPVDRKATAPPPGLLEQGLAPGEDNLAPPEFRAAVQAYASGAFAEALRAFESLETRGDGWLLPPEARFDRALCLAGLGKREEARRLLLRRQLRHRVAGRASIVHGASFNWNRPLP